MPTHSRRESFTGVYHVIVKGINNERIYNQSRERGYFKSIILACLAKYKVEIYSYCIMSTHAHFIIGAEIQVLSAFMSAVLSEYASYYNFKHHRNGHVFQNRFKSECIETETYFWNCLRYIHLNPVKAKMIKNAERYKFSSMAEYISGEPELIHKKAISMYEKKFDDVDAFQAFHRQRQTDVFLDTAEDVKAQLEEMALYLAQTMQAEYNLPLLSQVFEEKAIREAYKERLRLTYGLSKKRVEWLCSTTREQIEKM